MKVGSLFSGYGGLDMAVGGDLAWYSEIEPAACTVLEQLHPDVPNLGDITAVDWSQVEPVDVITGGYPCQPFSNAGKRKGKQDERHLWPYVRDAISALRPSLAVLENVRGHLSLGLADVIGDLAGLGYDARWGVVRAADAGAPHKRARVFITATNADSSRRGKHSGTVAKERKHGATEHGGDVAANSNGDGYGGGGRAPEDWEAWKQAMKASHKNGNGHGASLEQEALSIGASTPPQSTAGKSLPDQHQPPLPESKTATDSTPSLLSG